MVVIYWGCSTKLKTAIAEINEKIEKVNADIKKHSEMITNLQSFLLTLIGFKVSKSDDENDIMFTLNWYVQYS